jgi:hypothetical protein
LEGKTVLSVLLMLAAAPVRVMSPPTPMMREITTLPMPAEWHTLSQPHANSDDRMFPDVAVKDIRIDGDTLYVRLINQGRSGTRVPIAIAARAAVDGMKSDEIQTRTGRLAAGESRWVALKGFSVKSAAISASIFDLASASAVSAAAWLLPSTAGTLDRSGQGCGECSIDADEKNNILSLKGNSIAHGRPFSTNGS